MEMMLMAKVVTDTNLGIYHCVLMGTAKRQGGNCLGWYKVTGNFMTKFKSEFAKHGNEALCVVSKKQELPKF